MIVCIDVCVVDVAIVQVQRGSCRIAAVDCTSDAAADVGTVPRLRVRPLCPVMPCPCFPQILPIFRIGIAIKYMSLIEVPAR